MRLLEYEAKQLLRQATVAVPSGTLITSSSQLTDLPLPIVLKAQVPIGGRGKLGGVVVVDTPDGISNSVQSMLKMNIKGYTPASLLAEEKLDIDAEYYLALLIDYSSSDIKLVAHTNGGVDVEENELSDFFTVSIDATNITDCAAQVSDYLNYPLADIDRLVHQLYSTFIENDMTLLEVNPLVRTTSGELVCGDCKIELDASALFRHPDWNYEQPHLDANFVTLNPDGNIATIANGAGLAMATVDAISASGLKPINFLDIGGGANVASILHAFERIVSFPGTEAIVINIFAGITRCDEVARAIIEAKNTLSDLPPLFIRLAGTNFEDAVAILKKENITTLATLEECIDAVLESRHA